MRVSSVVPNDRRKIPGSEAGFSIVELLIVVAIGVILTAISVFSLMSSKRSYAPDDEATQIVSFFREAHQRALTQRQTQRVTIDRTTLEVRLVDEGLLPGGDEVEIMRGTLNGTVAMTQPSVDGTVIPVPPGPFNYAPAPFVNGQCQFRFRSDGSVFDAAGNPISATLFFMPVEMTDDRANLVRAVTLFGPSGSVRSWRYDSANTNFIAGVW